MVVRRARDRARCDASTFSRRRQASVSWVGVRRSRLAFASGVGGSRSGDGHVGIQALRGVWSGVRGQAAGEGPGRPLLLQGVLRRPGGADVRTGSAGGTVPRGRAGPGGRAPGERGRRGGRSGGGLGRRRPAGAVARDGIVVGAAATAGCGERAGSKRARGTGGAGGRGRGLVNGRTMPGLRLAASDGNGSVRRVRVRRSVRHRPSPGDATRSASVGRTIGCPGRARDGRRRPRLA